MNKKRLFISIALINFLFGLIAAHAISATWTIEAVDAPKSFNNISSRAIATDSYGNPHIVYGMDHLYYAYHDGMNWHYETVDSLFGVGSYAAIAIDTFNNVHISYYDSVDNILKYATKSLGYWVSETVDGSGNGGSYTSIALDSLGKVHISYYGYYALKYATNASGSWITSTKGACGAYCYTSIAIDSLNKVHISFNDI